MTKKEAIRITVVGIAMVIVLEGCAAYKIGIRQGDALAGLMIVTSWFKEFFKAVVERLLSDL